MIIVVMLTMLALFVFFLTAMFAIIVRAVAVPDVVTVAVAPIFVFPPLRQYGYSNECRQQRKRKTTQFH